MKPEAPKRRPVFENAVDIVLSEALAIATQRGGEYQDSWHVANVRTTFLDHVLREIGTTSTPEQKRLVIMASLVDVKMSRLCGPYKRDTYIDAINYLACLCHLMDEYAIACHTIAEADRA